MYEYLFWTVILPEPVLDTNWEMVMNGMVSHTFPPGPRGCTEKENNSHLEFSSSSYALLVLPFLEIWVLERWCFIKKSFPHNDKLILSPEECFVIRVFSECQRSALSSR